MEVAASLGRGCGWRSDRVFRWKRQCRYFRRQGCKRLGVMITGAVIAHRSGPEAIAFQNLGHGGDRGEVLLADAMLAERLDGLLGGQPAMSNPLPGWRMERVMATNQLPEQRHDFRMFLFPELVAGKGGAGAVTDKTSTDLMETQCDRLAPPAKQLFRPRGIAPAVFQGNRGLKGTSVRPPQSAGGRAQRLAMRFIETRMSH